MKKQVLVLAILASAATFAHADDRPLILSGGSVRQIAAGNALGVEVLHVATSSNLGAATAASLSVSGTASVTGVLTVGSCVGCGGGGGGITNSAPTNTIMLSNGTNAVTSALSTDGTTYYLNAPFQVGDGVTARDTLVKGGLLYGWSNTGGTYDYKFDPEGPSYIDSVVGANGHGSGTNETLAIGWTGGAVTGHGGPLLGQLDIRTNGNTIINKDSGAAYINATDTVNTGSSPRASYAIDVVQASGRGTGTGALSTYGIRVDNACNGQVCYGIDIVRGGERIEAGGLTVAAGTTAVQALTATTINGVGAMSVTGSITASTNIVSTSGSINAPTFNLTNMQMFGGSTENDIYIPSASNNNINIDSSGTGTVKINSNADGITNSGTGGLEVYAGNNGSTAKGGVTSAGATWGVEIHTTSKTGPKWTSGAGAPAASCNVGDLYSNTSGGTSTTLYVCTATNTFTAK